MTLTTITYFHERVFRVRLAELGIRSLTEFARRADISESYARQLAGGYIPPVETRQRIAQVLETEPERIWAQLTAWHEAK